MGYNTKSLIDQAIEKFGGADEAYKQKLKYHIREGMGYSNYINKMNAAAGKPLSLNLKGNITPGGVKSLVSGAINMQQDEMGAYGDMANRVDTVAGGLAAEQAAREKAAGNKLKDNPLGFEPNDWLDKQIKYIATNGITETDANGNTVTRPATKDDIKKQIFGMVMGEGDLSDTVFMPGLNEKMIGERVDQRLPQDFSEKSDYYSYLNMGYTKAQAQDLQTFNRYSKGEMGAAEKAVYEVANPTWVARAEELKNNKGLLQDIGTTTDPNTGQTTPKYTYDELKQKYPGVQETTLKEMVKPVEAASMQDDVKQWYQANGDAINELVKEKVEKGGGYTGVMSSATYKEFKTKLEMEYGQVFTSAEIDQLIYNTIRSAQ